MTQQQEIANSILKGLDKVDIDEATVIYRKNNSFGLVDIKVKSEGRSKVMEALSEMVASVLNEAFKK